MTDIAQQPRLPELSFWNVVGRIPGEISSNVASLHTVIKAVIPSLEAVSLLGVDRLAQLKGTFSVQKKLYNVFNITDRCNEWLGRLSGLDKKKESRAKTVKRVALTIANSLEAIIYCDVVFSRTSSVTALLGRVKFLGRLTFAPIETVRQMFVMIASVSSACDAILEQKKARKKLKEEKQAVAKWKTITLTKTELAQEKEKYTKDLDASKSRKKKLEAEVTKNKWKKNLLKGEVRSVDARIAECATCLQKLESGEKDYAVHQWHIHRLKTQACENKIREKDFVIATEVSKVALITFGWVARFMMIEMLVVARAITVLLALSTGISGVAKWAYKDIVIRENEKYTRQWNTPAKKGSFEG